MGQPSSNQGFSYRTTTLESVLCGFLVNKTILGITTLNYSGHPDFSNLIIFFCCNLFFKAFAVSVSVFLCVVSSKYATIGSTFLKKEQWEVHTNFSILILIHTLNSSYCMTSESHSFDWGVVYRSHYKETWEELTTFTLF